MIELASNVFHVSSKSQSMVRIGSNSIHQIQGCDKNISASLVKDQVIYCSLHGRVCSYNVYNKIISK